MSFLALSRAVIGLILPRFNFREGPWTAGKMFHFVWELDEFKREVVTQVRRGDSELTQKCSVWIASTGKWLLVAYN